MLKDVIVIIAVFVILMVVFSTAFFLFSQFVEMFAQAPSSRRAPAQAAQPLPFDDLAQV